MSRQTQSQVAEGLARKCHFEKSEVECLLQRYKQMCQQKKMDRACFRDFLNESFNITDDIIMDRVFKAFDKDNDSVISCQEWVQGLSIFLRGTHEEKVKFCFEVYDMNGDNFITREEMFHLLKPAVVKNYSRQTQVQIEPVIANDEDPDEGIKDLVEIVVKKMDRDMDARLSLNDYRQAVKEEPLLLEAFGFCLPTDKCVNAFMMSTVGKLEVQPKSVGQRSSQRPSP